jgi:DNA invertase Pin-like site-specific DNA recombinase
MNESLKVQPRHLERGAYLYVRQSSMRQVLENVESTKRQYALRGRAIALGWRDDQIIVIDNDQGESGASAAWREGFQRLVTDVGMGHAGIVMGLEVSRLARNNADWHRLPEICALADTLILDEDGVYDPASFNDRLLLGLKATMSEAELHVLKARLRGGILNKVRRGEYRCPLGAISREPQNPPGQRSRLRGGPRGAAARRGGAPARTRGVRSMRTPLPRSICHATRQTGSLVCL